MPIMSRKLYFGSDDSKHDRAVEAYRTYLADADRKIAPSIMSFAKLSLHDLIVSLWGRSDSGNTTLSVSWYEIEFLGVPSSFKNPPIEGMAWLWHEVSQLQSSIYSCYVLLDDAEFSMEFRDLRIVDHSKHQIIAEFKSEKSSDVRHRQRRRK